MGERPFVAGVDSSTQSCKVVVWDPVSGEVVREGRAPHPEGTEVDPRALWDALNEAVAAAVAAAEARLGDTGRVLLRPSGTEPLVRVMVEAATQEEADSVAASLADVVKENLAL